ncbi:MAG: hypothetical protein FVQ81_03250 [Candidatus Glassbacteria bacterium]|nr:hypothetical protein [Candidatus Glassbacteria bacterium]
MDYVDISGKKVSRIILGTNPFSGFSHQGLDRDREMIRFYTARKVLDTMHEAQRLGINTVIARTDNFVIRMLMEFEQEGGSLQWFAQTCPEVGPQEMCIERAAAMNAPACHLHGGVADHLYLNGRLDEFKPLVAMIKERGMLAAIAAHQPEVFEWAAENLELDYFMCSYYNPIPRGRDPRHVSGQEEVYEQAHRERVTGLIQTLPAPAIHYKVMAAGRNDPAEALGYVAGKLRPDDPVCIGVYTADKQNMIAENIDLLDAAMSAAVV